MLEQHLQKAINAHYWTSHRPEKRGEALVQEYSNDLKEDIEKLEALGVDTTNYRKKYEDLFLAWLNAKSNCISSMITGPSNFPTRKAEKANAREHARHTELQEFRKHYIARVQKNIRKREAAKLNPVQEMEKKIERAKRDQELMKAINKTIRKKATNEEKVKMLVEIGGNEEQARQLLTPDFMGRIGCAQYLLTNNLANIKRMEDRLKILKSKAAAETKEVEREDGVKVVENTEKDRLQIFFPGRPEQKVIDALKKSAFKWSPFYGCWQRQLTENAKQSLSKILNNGN